MNPKPKKPVKLKRKLPVKGGSLHADFRNLSASPFIDSLMSITQPTGLSYQKTDGDVAHYNLDSREIVMHAPAFMLSDTPPQTHPDSVTWNPSFYDRGIPVADVTDTPSGVLAHEFGHSFAQSGPYYPWTLQKAVQRGPMKLRAGQYGSKDPDEHVAEAFSNAIQYMRYADGLRPTSVESAHEQLDESARLYERSVPGTRAMSEIIMDQVPSHPLRTLRRLPRRTAPADATRVKKK